MEVSDACNKEEGCNLFTAKYCQVCNQAREWQKLRLDGRWAETAGLTVSAKLFFS